MRSLNVYIHWATGLEFLRQPLAQEIEIGLGVSVWIGLVFVVVHFGGLMAT